jgi:hypothetical protein
LSPDFQMSYVIRFFISIGIPPSDIPFSIREISHLAGFQIYPTSSKKTYYSFKFNGDHIVWLFRWEEETLETSLLFSTYLAEAEPELSWAELSPGELHETRGGTSKRAEARRGRPAAVRARSYGRSTHGAAHYSVRTGGRRHWPARYVRSRSPARCHSLAASIYQYFTARRHVA